MKIITLSDHTQDMLDQAAAARLSAYRREQETYSDAVHRRSLCGQQRRRAFWQALRRFQLLAVLQAAWSMLVHPLPSVPARPAPPTPTQQETIWANGSEGEERVLRHLAGSLDDAWTLVRGYRNGGGEIDQLLVGPKGVVAIEVKNLNGVVYCNSDRWWRDKFDRYGNRVESGLPIADRNGRSPSRQVNEAADRLEQFLVQGHAVVRIRRVVVMSHELAKLGAVTEPTVDLVTTLQGWTVARFLGLANTLTRERVDQVLATIQNDHAFHARRLDPKRQVRPGSLGPRQQTHYMGNQAQMH